MTKVTILLIFASQTLLMSSDADSRFGAGVRAAAKTPKVCRRRRAASYPVRTPAAYSRGSCASRDEVLDTEFRSGLPGCTATRRHRALGAGKCFTWRLRRRVACNMPYTARKENP